MEEFSNGQNLESKVLETPKASSSSQNKQKGIKNLPTLLRNLRKWSAVIRTLYVSFLTVTPIHLNLRLFSRHQEFLPRQKKISANLTEKELYSCLGLTNGKRGHNRSFLKHEIPH